MATHLTARLAWHDNNWDGNICKDPEKNDYCVGSHSLLSARMARRRDLKKENPNKGKSIDAAKDYMPPCYWSANAFCDKSKDIDKKDEERDGRSLFKQAGKRPQKRGKL